MKRPKPGAAQGEAERLAGLICSLCLVLRGYDYSSRYCTLAAKMQPVTLLPRMDSNQYAPAVGRRRAKHFAVCS